MKRDPIPVTVNLKVAFEEAGRRAAKGFIGAAIALKAFSEELRRYCDEVNAAKALRDDLGPVSGARHEPGQTRRFADRPAVFRTSYSNAKVKDLLRYCGEAREEERAKVSEELMGALGRCAALEDRVADLEAYLEDARKAAGILGTMTPLTAWIANTRAMLAGSNAERDELVGIKHKLEDRIADLEAEKERRNLTIAEVEKKERERIASVVESWNLENALGYRVGGPTLRAALEPKP